jgi:protein FrlC
MALRKLILDEGLEIASYIPAQFRYPTNLCCNVDAVRKDSVRYIKESIENAVALGAEMVSVCPGHTLFGQSREDGLKRLTDSLWEISSFALRHKIKIAIEPADHFETDLLNTCTQTLEFINQADCSNLGVLLDNGHEFIVGQNSNKTVKEMGHKLFYVHVDDNNGKRDQHLIPGDGEFDFAPFISALKTANYDGYICAELSWDYTQDPDTAAKLTAERLRDMLTRY